MGRKSSVEEDQLIGQLSCVFREVGYEGATLTMLSEATGLKKASLYYRFPYGKEQMAREVLDQAWVWLEEHILAPLGGAGTPSSRIDEMVRQLDKFYSGGKQACLLNMLSSSQIQEGPFTALIQGAFEAWIAGLSTVVMDAGRDEKTARLRAERAIMMLQGSLVLSRGMRTTRPFKDFVRTVRSELLEK